MLDERGGPGRVDLAGGAVAAVLRKVGTRNLGEQVDRFVGDIGTTIRDLADRGRASSKVAAEDAADKAADLADKAAAKAADLADKADEGAHRAADKFGDSAQRAADAFGEKAESASERVDDVVEDAADKADDPRLREQW